ncbi:hypothetical protein U9R90_00510 [Streptomyces sp. E11-3]|uniref:hypothetical protein n=1 Tax=Streptomyces sp. E11-3 TaxID=3110112 RepID=UPI00397EA6E4
MPKLIEAANQRVSGANVRAVHVRAPGSLKADSATAAADPVPQPVVPASPVQRPAPPDGYRRAIEAHRQATRPSRIDSGIAEAVERQTAAMRELGRRAFLEPPSVPDGATAPIEQDRVQRRRQAAATEAAALRRARAEHAARTQGAVG